MAEKLEVNQGIAFLKTLASFLNDNITLTSDLQIRPGGLIGKRTPDKEDLIFNLLAQLLKLATFTFKNQMMGHCPKSYYINQC